MKRYSISILIVGLLIVPEFCFALSLREETLSSVVQIIAISEEGEVMGGSGTTISKDGLILTNSHVVQDKETEKIFSSLTLCYTVSQYEPPKCAATAKVIATIPEYDLALIKPDKKIDEDGKVTKVNFNRFKKGKEFRFTPVLFKNPSTGILPNILDSVTAWGYPVVGGSTVTVTRGSVSGFSLVGEGAERIIKFLKTDVYINPGNSGGAAFDDYYAYVGLPSNAFQGQLGFIIPVNTAVAWLKDLDSKKIIQLSKIDSVTEMNFTFNDLHEGDPLLNIALQLRHLHLMEADKNGNFGPNDYLLKTDAESIITKMQDSPSVLAGSRNSPYINEQVFVQALNSATNSHSLTVGVNQPLTRSRAALYIFEALNNQQY